MKIFLLLTFLFSLNAFSGTKEYIVGSGSEFKFYSEKGASASLSIYITESSFAKLGVEYFFSTGGVLGNETWQQYIMGIADKGFSLDEGYIQSSNMLNAEIMTNEFKENNNKGVKLEDFFFSKASDIEKFKIGVESIEVPAGTLMATHYQKKRDEQIVDFWISDSAGSIGLVKLISKGVTNNNQNYKIELLSLLKNVKAKINPKKAVPLTDKGRMFLGKPNKK
jgi:hypothetical protein